MGSKQNALSELKSEQRGWILDMLLKKHPELVPEAVSLAEGILDDVSVEAICDHVKWAIGDIDDDTLYERSGSHSWGYVEPYEAADELMQEAIDELDEELKQCMKAQRWTAGELTCQGVLRGLYEVKDEKTGALGWSPDFPAEAAATHFESFLELCPESRMREMADRVLQALEDDLAEWVGVLKQSVDRIEKKKMRKRRH